MNFIKQILISVYLTFTQFFSKIQPGPPQETQVSRPQEDSFNTWLHHDDVTLKEMAMLDSNDPVQIQQAQDAIFRRQAEVAEWRADKEQFLKDAYAPYSDNILEGCRIKPMSEMEGWEDNDLPTHFISHYDENGEPVWEAFDDEVF